MYSFIHMCHFSCESCLSYDIIYCECLCLICLRATYPSSATLLVSQVKEKDKHTPDIYSLPDKKYWLFLFCWLRKQNEQQCSFKQFFNWMHTGAYNENNPRQNIWGDIVLCTYNIWQDILLSIKYLVRFRILYKILSELSYHVLACVARTLKCALIKVYVLLLSDNSLIRR